MQCLSEHGSCAPGSWALPGTHAAMHSRPACCRALGKHAALTGAESAPWLHVHRKWWSKLMHGSLHVDMHVEVTSGCKYKYLVEL